MTNPRNAMHMSVPSRRVVRNQAGGYAGREDFQIHIPDVTEAGAIRAAVELLLDGANDGMLERAQLAAMLRRVLVFAEARQVVAEQIDRLAADMLLRCVERGYVLEDDLLRSEHDNATMLEKKAALGLACLEGWLVGSPLGGAPYTTARMVGKTALVDRESLAAMPAGLPEETMIYQARIVFG